MSDVLVYQFKLYLAETTTVILIYIVLVCHALGEIVHPEWTKSSSEGGLELTPDRVAAVLDFLSELAQEAVMKDWMGGPEGNVFWPALLALLCNTPPPQTTQTHASLLGATHTQKVKYEDFYGLN